MMKTIELTGITILGEIVKENFNTSKVFYKYNIDFCCNGHRTLQVASQEAKVDMEVLIKELKDVLSASELNSDILDLSGKTLSQSCKAVVDKYHVYIRETSESLKLNLIKIAKVHGESHTELNEVANIFTKASDELLLHLMKEEEILFPFIEQMEHALLKGEDMSGVESCFGSVGNPISMMKEEHNAEGEYFERIRVLTNDFEIPSDACGTYTISMKGLAEYVKLLHEHIHIENNIIFKTAIEMEGMLSASKGCCGSCGSH